MGMHDITIRALFINGYILLYAFSTVFAGCVGLLGFWLATKILHFTMGNRIIPWRNHIEFTRGLCVLICATMYLICAVGLLFMHLVGGLPREYDEIAVQVGIAAFGITMFVIMCLSIFALLACVLWLRHLGFNRDDVLREADEETGLLGNKVYRIYGCKDPRHKGLYYGVTDEDEQDKENEEDEEEEETMRDDRFDPPYPDRCRLKMTTVSSIRDLDLRRMNR